MSRRYHDVIIATTRPDAYGYPLLVGFTWRGTYYQVAKVLSVRRLGPHAKSVNYVVETPDHRVFELHRDDASGVWVLDGARD